MSSLSLLRALLRRLRRKLAALLPVIAGALVVTVGLAALVHLLTPLLPAPAQELLAAMQSGDLATSRARLEAFFAAYGDAAVFVFLGAQVLQVIIAPIPGQLVGLLGGYLFGFWYGLALTMTGLALGSLLAMAGARLLGEQLVRRVVPRDLMAQFDYLIARGGLASFFLIFLLPALPDDAVCFIAGLTRLRLWKLMLVCVLGRLPGMAVLTFVGANLGSEMLLANLTLGLALGAALLLWLFSEECEAAMKRLVRGRTLVGAPGDEQAV